MGKLGDVIRKALDEGASAAKQRIADESAASAARALAEQRSKAKILAQLEQELPDIVKSARAKGWSQVRIHSLKDWGGGPETCLAPVDMAVLRALRDEGLDVFIDYDLSGNARADHALALRLEGGPPPVTEVPMELFNMIDRLPDELVIAVENYCWARGRRSK